jgi:ribonuclease Y
MVGVLYAALAVVLVLGLLFLDAYRRRSTGSDSRSDGRNRSGSGRGRRHQPGASAGPIASIGATLVEPALPASDGGPSMISDAARQPSGLDLGTAGLADDARGYLQAVRSAAETEAESIRLSAQTEAESVRRSAAADAEAIRREAQSAAELSEAAAARSRMQAQADVDARLAEGRAAAEAEAARITESALRVERELTERLTRHAAAEAELTAQLDKVGAEVRALELSVEQVAAREVAVDQRAERLDQREQQLADATAALSEQSEQAAQLRQQLTSELERVAGLTADEAKSELMTAIEVSARRDAAVLARTIENEARAEAGQRARGIVVEAVQRVASEQTTETVVSVLHLPSDEMKGRIIGREGRNIRAFEAVTGVNVIIDDTPEAVLLSCFDPVRREVGRLSLEKLILDGRIHPHRIEEVYEQSKAEVDDLCLRAASDALADVGINDLDDRLLPTLGRLRYRTSYGQNVLGHLVESAHIAGVMAAELGVEPALVKRCAFLHDIGKALTHEVEGSHAVIGAELLRRFGESEAVAHAVEAHHNEVMPRTIEAVLTQASDSCSAARPGARRESLETYVKRLARIEEIATARPGVEKVFAMQAGREVRVMVQPSEVDDLAAQVIAREIAKQIEDELTYPGQIRVTVVRESRSTEVAH